MHYNTESFSKAVVCWGFMRDRIRLLENQWSSCICCQNFRRPT